MIRKYSALALLTGLALLISNSCKKESSNPLAELMTITLAPGDTAVDIGQTVQYHAIGMFADSSVRDITNEVQWFISPSTKYSITSGGLATASDTGSTFVYAAGGYGITGGVVLECVTGEKLKRRLVQLDYDNNYLGSEINDAEWTGNTTNCVAGTNAESVHQKVVQRINYYRRLIGLPGDVTLSSDLNANCMEAALMMKANNALNHFPPSTWTCFTDVGATAAKNSNLALGMHSVHAVDGYIEDFGNNNLAVGHRRWILFSRAKVMGDGSTDGSNAIWVMGNDNNPVPAGLQIVAYPPNGYIPQPLAYDRWSFGVPDITANFASAQVTILDKNNAPVNVTVISREQGYGDNSIIWEPSGIITTGPDDQVYNVSITNVIIGGSPKTFTYKVTIIPPDNKKKSTYLELRKSTPDLKIL